MNSKMKIGLGLAAIVVIAGGGAAYFTLFHIPSNDFVAEDWQAQGAPCANVDWVQACTRFTMVDDLQAQYPVGSSAAEAFAAMTNPAEALNALGGSIGFAMMHALVQALSSQSTAGSGEAPGHDALADLGEITARYPIQHYSTGYLYVTFDFANDTVVAYEVDSPSVDAGWYRDQLDLWQTFSSDSMPFDATAWRDQAEACAQGDEGCTRARMVADLIETYGPSMYFGNWQTGDVETLLGEPGPKPAILDWVDMTYPIGNGELIYVNMQDDDGVDDIGSNRGW